MKNRICFLAAMVIAGNTFAGPFRVSPIRVSPIRTHTTRTHTTPVRPIRTTSTHVNQVSTSSSGLSTWLPIFMLWSATARSKTVETPKEPIKSNEVWRLEAPTKAEIKAAIEKRKKAQEALKRGDK